jgi:hypothetical protein
MAAYVSGALREHTCLLVVLEDAAEFLRQQSIRQRMSAYVSGALREHTCLFVVLEDAAEFFLAEEFLLKDRALDAIKVRKGGVHRGAVAYVSIR